MADLKELAPRNRPNQYYYSPKSIRQHYELTANRQRKREDTMQDILEQSATKFLGSLSDSERESLAAFLSSETALLELKTHLPYDFVRLAADALSRAGLD